VSPSDARRILPRATILHIRIRAFARDCPRRDCLRAAGVTLRCMPSVNRENDRARLRRPRIFTESPVTGDPPIDLTRFRAYNPPVSSRMLDLCGPCPTARVLPAVCVLWVGFLSAEPR